VTQSIKENAAFPRRRQTQRQVDEGEETVRTLRYIFFNIRIFRPQGTVSVILSQKAGTHGEIKRTVWKVVVKHLNEEQL
jgi:hypothetical protein